jgi:hypothetical protein
MGLAFDRDDRLVQHVPPSGRRLEVTGSMGGGLPTGTWGAYAGAETWYWTRQNS